MTKTLENALRRKISEAEKRGDVPAAMEFLKPLIEERDRNWDRIKEHPVIQFALDELNSANGSKSCIAAIENWKSAIKLAEDELP